MKTLIASLTLGTALIAAPALASPLSGDVAHRTTVAHQGSTMSVHYEPRFETSHKQTGIGPRATAGCLWTTRVAVERSVVDASGRPVAALTRLVGGEKTVSAMQAGHCRDLAPASVEADKLRGFVTAAAERDAHGLHGELASLSGLHAAASR